MANKNFKVKHGLDVAGSATVDADLTVTGNLTVNGTTTTLNTETLLIEDNIVVLNSNVTGTPTTDAGIEIERGDSTNSALTWTEADDKWYQNRAGVSTVLPINTTELTEGTNLYYTDGRFDTRLATKDTDDLAEGTTNLYFTGDRARAAVDNNVDLDTDVAGTYVKSIRDETYVLGELLARRQTGYINPPPNSSEVSGQNGFEAVSSGPDVAGPKGYNAGFTVTYYQGDTSAGSSTSPTLTLRNSAGTNATGGAAITANTVMGGINWNGHSGTDFASYVGTQNGGGGRQTAQPLQMQGFATQNFAESTISLATTATAQSNLTIAAVVSSGSGVFTNTSADVRQYDVVRVTGTLTGTMTFPGYVSGNIYYVIAGANPTTTFTLSAAQDGDAIATTAGTTTGLTFIRHRSIITFAAQTFAPFGSGSKVTVAGITPTGYNGVHRAVFGNTTQVGYGNYQTGTTQTVAGTVSIYNVTAGGVGFRVRGFPDNASYNNTNRVNFISHTPAAAIYRSDQFTFQAGTTTAQVTGDKLIYARQYINAYSAVDQTNPVANAENLMIFGTTDISNGISIVTNGTALTRITFANAGVYNLQFSAQLSQTSGGSANAFIWLKKNGANVANSAGDTRVAGNGDRIMASWNYVFSAAAGDYYELAWAASDTSVILDYIAAAGVVPAIPSVILTVTPVGA